MKRFVKLFRGYPSDVENQINEMARKRNLTIVSVTTCTNDSTFYATVIFEKSAD